MRHRFRPLLLLPFFLPSAGWAKEDAFVEGEVLVTFKENVAVETAKGTLGRHSLNLTERYDGISAKRRRVCGMIREKSRTTAAMIADLKDDPSVETVEPNYIRHVTAVTPNDPYFNKLWGLQNTGQIILGAPGTVGNDTRFLQAWSLSRPASAEIVVGVIDTGVEISHPDLAANIWTNPGEIAGNGVDDDGDGYKDDIHGWDFANNTAAITDSSYHGTHVAGTIAAAGKNGTGVIGLNFHAKILPMKVSADGETMVSSAIIAACNYAVTLKNKGINIVAVNGSYGGRSYSINEFNAMTALRDAGVIFCAAAGNLTDEDMVLDNDAKAEYPANYNVANVISIAALTPTNELADFSHYGATTVDLAAPGVNIYSTAPVNLVVPLATVILGATSYEAMPLQYTGVTTTTGITRPIINCGSGLAAADFPAAVSGNIALIKRGTTNFSDKVTLAKNAGAVGTIIYDNVTEGIQSFTLGAAGTWLPSVSLTLAAGNAILASLPATGTLIIDGSNKPGYQFLDGTSMAAPHVAAAVAFAAWNFPSETVAQRVTRILDHTTPVGALAGKMLHGRLNLLSMIDTDGDGLPDWWETENFGSLAKTGTGDEDGDGFSNLSEFFSGTNPKSAASKLTFASYLPVTNSSGRNFALSFSSIAERSYQIEWSNTLEASSWTLLGTTVLGTGSPIQIIDPNAIDVSPKRFYRLKILNE